MFSSAAVAERDYDSIMEVAQAYRERRINTGSFGVREEMRKHLFTKGSIIFPDATNLPTAIDAYKEWVDAKLLRIDQFPLSVGKLGYVEIAILIDENGLVNDTYIIESSNDQLNQLAEKSVRAWKFRPGLLDGKTSKTVWIIPFTF